jgi:AcrR family transcriptional regulator
MAYRQTDRMEKRLAQNRQRILRAVRVVVAKGGFSGAHVAAVAEAASVATGTVYRHFPSKAELFAEALALNAQHEIDVIAAVVDAEGAPFQRLADAVHIFARRAVRGRRLAYAMIAEPAEPAVDAARLKYRQALADIFEHLIRDGVAAGAFPPQDASASAACLIGALLEGLIGPLARDCGEVADTRAVVEPIAAFCLRAVAGRHVETTVSITEGDAP